MKFDITKFRAGEPDGANEARYALYSELRRRMDVIWDLVKQPVKFPAPARRRRSDREIPKAA